MFNLTVYSLMYLCIICSWYTLYFSVIHAVMIYCGFSYFKQAAVKLSNIGCWIEDYFEGVSSLCSSEVLMYSLRLS